MALGISTRKMIQKISDTIWEAPITFKESMRVPARIYATEKLMSEMDEDVLDQITNVATLPGITKYAFCMPDGHRRSGGYGCGGGRRHLARRKGSQTFFSTAHGSGRTMSRTKARRQWQGKALQRDLEERGVYFRTASWPGLAEEAGPAYKSIDEVVEATELAGISKRVARFAPIGNVKG